MDGNGRLCAACPGIPEGTHEGGGAVFVKLTVHRAGLPGKKLCNYIVPLDPAGKAGLAGALPVKGTNPSTGQREAFRIIRGKPVISPATCSIPHIGPSSYNGFTGTEHLRE